MNLQKNTKKRLTAALLAGLTLAVAAPALAASNPFSDVPAKHWAYDAVAKLAAAGIVDGYGDGTFRGDKTMTRFEMAQIVAKAMAHQDKANAEQKAMIGKLSQEFQDELDNLGVRVSTLEKKIGNITWSGQVREWYQWADQDGLGEGKNALNTRLLLFLQAPLTEELAFHGRIWAESGWGEATDHGTGADAAMDQAYLAGKHGNISWTLGRQGIQLGQGLIYAWFANNDGATLTFGSDSNTQLTLAAFKNEAVFTSLDPADLNIIAANLLHRASKNLDLTLAYAKSKKQDLNDLWSYHDLSDADLINTWALGAKYTGIKNITLTGEYGRNNSDAAKGFKDATVYYATGETDYSAADAWVAQVKYKGAQWDKPHSYGVWVGYRKAEPGFFGRNGDLVWETPTNIYINYPEWDAGYMMDNVKGFDFGFDYTVFKNGIFSVQYFDLETDVITTGANLTPTDANDNKKSFVAQLRYIF